MAPSPWTRSWGFRTAASGSATSSRAAPTIRPRSGCTSRSDSSPPAPRTCGREGRRVVRLKGGDRCGVGGGGEEGQGLREAGVACEVVPGVTAGVAAPAYAGIPVTHRDEASAVAFITGHEDPDKAEAALDWFALAAFPGTLVFYMGVGNIEGIARRLIEAGRAEDEPVAVVERGTLPGQRTVMGILADIDKRVEDAGVRPPAITLVGPV